MALSLSGKKVVVVGLGTSGRAAAVLCVKQGARVTVTDSRPASALDPTLPALPSGVVEEFGGHRPETFTTADLIVLSPGVPPDQPALSAARAAGVPITGELELASHFVSGSIVAVTGTNGKSTTTSVCGAILSSTGRPTFVGGNLGVPLSAAVGRPAALAGGVCVVEASSFQLETVKTMRPQVAVLLNITPDHLDRHPDSDSYAAAKARIFAAQEPSDFAVFNADDPIAARLVRSVPSHRIGFSTRAVLNEGGWVEPGALCVRLPGGEVERYPSHLPGLIGRHNLENALAALLAARLEGALPREARRGLLTFRPLSHRMQLVADAHGVAFFDDSKGTNVGAVTAALEGFPRPVVLIAGGRDKGGSYETLAVTMKLVGRAAVLIGEATPQLRAALSPVVAVETSTDMDDAVARAAALAQPGDAVVLSPACSSFDMFRNYADRGEAFHAAVTRLLAARASAPAVETHP
jgi:UDP-N-acetylmuramoylalanine--D-glutamate ligase